MRIWIDLANSPHVLFFRPLVRRFRDRGHEVHFTARDFAQTLPLAAKFAMECTVIGRHGGRGRLKKVVSIVGRARALAHFGREIGAELAVSHNSYAHVLAARWIGVPAATLMDYEYQPANHLAFRAARRVIVPEVFPREALKRFGASSQRTCFYPGLKEEVYLSDFEPTEPAEAIQLQPLAKGASILLDAPRPDQVIVVLRPPATMAAYHPRHNPLFPVLLDRVANAPHVVGILLPRTPAQAEEYRQAGIPNLYTVRDAVDGPRLIHRADLVVSAGGTMNREAAVLGTPAATIFWGRMGAVDRDLVERGLVRVLARREDVEALPLVKKPPGARLQRPALADEVARLILETPGVPTSGGRVTG